MSDHITGEHPIVVDVRLPKRYRTTLVVSVFFVSVALLIGSIVIIGPANAAARHSAQTQAATDRSIQETLCRAAIADVVGAAAIDNATAQSDLVLTLGDPTKTVAQKQASRDALKSARDLNNALASVRAAATTTCHDNPSYRLPDPLTTGGNP